MTENRIYPVDMVDAPSLLRDLMRVGYSVLVAQLSDAIGLPSPDALEAHGAVMNMSMMLARDVRMPLFEEAATHSHQVKPSGTHSNHSQSKNTAAGPSQNATQGVTYHLYTSCYLYASYHYSTSRVADNNVRKGRPHFSPSSLVRLGAEFAPTCKQF